MLLAVDAAGIYIATDKSWKISLGKNEEKENGSNFFFREHFLI